MTNEEIAKKAERDIEFVVSNPDMYDVSVQVKNIIRTLLTAKDTAHQKELEEAVRKERERIKDQINLINRQMFNVNGNQICVEGETKFLSVTKVFEALTPTNNQ